MDPEEYDVQSGQVNFQLWLIDWLIDWCLTSSEQFFSYIQDDPIM
jgi:hypothetical protein